MASLLLGFTARQGTCGNEQRLPLPRALRFISPISKACNNNNNSSSSGSTARSAATSTCRAVSSPGDAGVKGSREDLQQQEAGEQQPDQVPQPPLCLSDDAASAVTLSAYTTPELYGSLLVFSLCSCNGLVENSEQMLALCFKLLGSRLTFLASKHALIKVFCGSENLEQLTKTLDRLKQRNMGAVLDFAAEQPVPAAAMSAAAAATAMPAATAATAAAKTSAAVDPYQVILRRTRETITLASERGGGYAAMKVSAIGDPETMQKFNCLLLHIHRLFDTLAVRLSAAAVLWCAAGACVCGAAAAAVSKQQFVSALARLHVDPSQADALFEHLLQQPEGASSSSSSKSSSGEGKVSYFQWSPESPLRLPRMSGLCAVFPLLLPDDLATYKATHPRFHSLCDFARRQQDPPMLLVDAEQSTIQTYIHALARETQK
ncbi:hypothetical protein Esti_003843 [Eimeria stiedai]